MKNHADLHDDIKQSIKTFAEAWCMDQLPEINLESDKNIYPNFLANQAEKQKKDQDEKKRKAKDDEEENVDEDEEYETPKKKKSPAKKERTSKSSLPPEIDLKVHSTFYLFHAEEQKFWEAKVEGSTFYVEYGSESGGEDRFKTGTNKKKYDDEQDALKEMVKSHKHNLLNYLLF